MLTEGIKIATKNGYKDIDKISIGDVVIAWDENNKEFIHKIVGHISNRKFSGKIYTIWFSELLDKIDLVRCDYKIGDEVLYHDLWNNSVKKRKILNITSRNVLKTEVFDIDVNNYIASGVVIKK